MVEFFAKVFNWLKGLLQPKPAAAAPPVSIPDNFESAFAYLLPNEGGYSDGRGGVDRGGPTNFGITIATLTRWRNRPELKLNHFVIVTADDVKNMKVDEAKLIYRQWYWTDVGLNLIKSKAIATCLFDQCVLEGQSTATKYAQLAANNCGASLKVDGECGPNTRAAFDQVDVARFMNAFVLQLKRHFDAIVAADNTHTQIANYDGWMNRAKRLLTLV